MTVLSPARVDLLAAQPLGLLDDISVADLRAAETPREVFERAGFAVHYWRPAAPASMFGNVEIVVEHPVSGLWFAASVEMCEQRHPSDALANLERALSASTVSGPAPASLTALTQSVATAAAAWLSPRFGEAWSTGGVLLGCLRVVEQSKADDLDATRMLIALADPDLLGQLDRLACWQANVASDRHALSEAAERAYVRATASLWPRFSVAAETVAKDIKPDRLLSYPREEWPLRAVEIVLDAVADQQTYVIRPLQASWQRLIRHPEGQPEGERFSVQGLLDMATVPDGVQVPTVR